MVGSWPRTRFLKYVAYWIKFQQREHGIDVTEDDDKKPRWWIEEGDPSGDPAFKDRKPLWRR